MATTSKTVNRPISLEASSHRVTRWQDFSGPAYFSRGNLLGRDASVLVVFGGILDSAGGVGHGSECPQLARPLRTAIVCFDLCPPFTSLFLTRPTMARRPGY